MSGLFDQGPACILPKIRMISELGRDLAFADLPVAVSPLRQRLELAKLISALIAADPALAPRGAIFDLAASLARLIDEMQGEGIPFSALENIDPHEMSEHWKRSRQFLALSGKYVSTISKNSPDPEARQRKVVERLCELWRTHPPRDPVIVVGSTGSRGTTRMLMEAVAELPQGALILPGFDREMSSDAWSSLQGSDRSPDQEEHPQYRFLDLIKRLGLSPLAVQHWTSAGPPSKARNALVSLALRPAPVTDAWRSEGPGLGDLVKATRGLTLLEAPDRRREASAIALLLREAVDAGKSAALVTPDRELSRRVTAQLNRWSLVPDDSAGQPLSLTPPGRLLRHTANLLAARLGLSDLLALLKHPLTHAADGRGKHLLMTRDLEQWLRHEAVPWVDRRTVDQWAREAPGKRAAWSEWIGLIIEMSGETERASLSETVTRHRALSEMLVSGHLSGEPSALWDKPAGRKAAEIMAELEREAAHGSRMDHTEYVSLLNGILSQEDVREPEGTNPYIMIWGTLEARVQGAERVILGGLNDGVWPSLPAPDPWLNRRMRAEMGLLSPERSIGLAAHDFQQAIAAKEAILTRSVRDDTAEPVSSRWLNRLTNLLEGLPENDGPAALAGMRQRGSDILATAGVLDLPLAKANPARRPSPRPPIAARPRKLSVTDIETLIRDPYAIYAKRILRLRPMPALEPEPDALLRGSLLHRVFAAFMRQWRHLEQGTHEAALSEITNAELAVLRWPLARVEWTAHLAHLARTFVAEESAGSLTAEFAGAEVEGALTLEELDFVVNGRADRIDRCVAGGLRILDYKSGSPPTRPQMERFAVQLPIEALIAEAGGFDGFAPETVREVGYVGLNGKPRPQAHPLVDDKAGSLSTGSVRNSLVKLLAAYGRTSTGYTSRRAVERIGFSGEFDHLARFGEWSDADPVHPVDVS